MHVTPSATSEKNRELSGSSPISLSCRRFLRPPSTEAPSLPRNYPASSVLPAAPPSQSARPVSHELPVDPKPQSPLGLPVLRMVHCACMPSPIPRQVGWNFVRSYDSTNFGLPSNRDGSAPALRFSRPAQRSLTLRPACSPSRLATLCTRGFSSLVASTAALIATGWSEPVPGRV